MNLTNIKNDMGFVSRQLIFNRVQRFSVPDDGGGWSFKKIADRDFSELGINYVYEISNAAKKFRPESEHTQSKYYKVFQIYTGDKGMYLHICDLLNDIAKQFEVVLETDEWREDDNQ